MKDCVSCVHEYLSPMSDTCRECGIAMLNYEEAKPKRITNADRIRAMTDEELAEFLDRWEMGDIDYSKTFCDLCKGQLGCHNDCLMGWLKQEATE